MGQGLAVRSHPVHEIPGGMAVVHVVAEEVEIPKRFHALNPQLEAGVFVGDAPHHFQKVRAGAVPAISPGLCRLVAGPVNHHAAAVRPLADPVVDVVEGRDQLGGFARRRHGGGPNRRGGQQGRRPSILVHAFCPFPLARRVGDCEEERLPAADLTFRPPFADHPVHWLAVCRIP